MAFVDQGKYPSRRAISIGGVILVHLAIGYALITGLAYQVIKKQITVIWAEEIEAPKAPPPIPKDPPTKKTKINIPVDPLVKTDPTPGQPPIFHQDPVSQQIPDEGKSTALPPQYARPLQVKGDRTSWVTTEDYPTEEIRSGNEGRVEILVRVGANGRVTSCQVTASSGHPALDEATCRFYAKRARFVPALAADGTPVEANHADRIRWQLPAQ